MESKHITRRAKKWTALSSRPFARRYKHVIKPLTVILIALFSNGVFASHYLVYAPIEPSKIFEVPDTGKFEIRLKGTDRLDFIEHPSGEVTRVDFRFEGLAEYLILDSVSLAKDGKGSELIYLLFDCIKNEEGRVVVVIESNSVKEIIEEQCKGL